MSNEEITIQEGPGGKWFVQVAGTSSTHDSFEIAKTVALKHFEQDNKVSLVIVRSREDFAAVAEQRFRLASKRKEARKKLAAELKALTLD